MAPESGERVGKNESLFREVNERIEDISRAFAGPEPTLVHFLCECSRIRCFDQIELTLGEYESVRSNPAQFIVVHGHVEPRTERVVLQTDHYAVVEKLGDAGEAAEERDPRDEV